VLQRLLTMLDSLVVVVEVALMTIASKSPSTGKRLNWRWRRRAIKAKLLDFENAAPRRYGKKPKSPMYVVTNAKTQRRFRIKAPTGPRKPSNSSRATWNSMSCIDGVNKNVKIICESGADFRKTK